MSFLVSLPDLSVLILLGVFVLTALRQVGSLRLQIWQVMTFGAISVLLLGEISPEEALGAINIDVLIFLFGAFCVGEALNRSGYLAWLGSRIVSRARNTDQLVLLVLFSTGILSAILMNDTLAIMGTPLVLQFFQKVRYLSQAHALCPGFRSNYRKCYEPYRKPSEPSHSN